MRELGKKYFDKNHRLRTEPLEPGMLVLSHDTAGAMNMSADHKLSFRWFGPFRILEVNAEKGTYTLSELDGARFKGTFAGNRLKRFYPREEEAALREEATLEEEQPERPPTNSAEGIVGGEEGGGEEIEDEDLYGPGDVSFSQQYAGENGEDDEAEADEDEEEEEGDVDLFPAPRRSERLRARSVLPQSKEDRNADAEWPPDGIVVEIPPVPRHIRRRHPLHVVGEPDEDWERDGED